MQSIWFTIAKKYTGQNLKHEAVKAAKKIGCPVVMKIASPQIIHKSDAGGVKVNLTNDA